MSARARTLRNLGLILSVGGLIVAAAAAEASSRDLRLLLAIAGLAIFWGGGAIWAINRKKNAE